MRWTLAVVVVVTVASAPGCSSSTAGTAATDAGTQDDSSEASSACSTVPNGAPVIQYDQVNQTLPVGMGGTIVAGTYYRTDVTSYTGPMGATGPSGMSLQATWVFSGVTATAATVDIVRSANGGADESLTDTLTISSGDLGVADTCPPSLSVDSWTFDATPTQITIYFPSPPERGIFAKQ
jgi:hypothetical protein